MQYNPETFSWMDGDRVVFSYPDKPTGTALELQNTLLWLLSKLEVKELSHLVDCVAWTSSMSRELNLPVLEYYKYRNVVAVSVNETQLDYGGGVLTANSEFRSELQTLGVFLRRSTSVSNWEELLKLAEAQRVNSILLDPRGNHRHTSAVCYRLLKNLRGVYAR